MFFKGRDNKSRNIILHGHIFKNAGSTFDWSLKRNFGKYFIDHRDDADLIKGKDRYLSDYFMNNQNVKAFSSHHLNAAFPTGFEYTGVNFFPIYILRHPIERVLSVYNFEKKQDSQSLGAVNAKKKNFREYVSWRMQPDIPATIRDFQTRYCAGFRGVRDLDEHIFNKALLSLDHYDFGFVEHFDESMVAFEDKLKPFFPDLDLSYIPQNVNREKGRPKDTIEEIRNELGDTFQDLLLKNSFDLKLYSAANDIFYKRIEEINNFKEKLKDFKNRCSDLS